ncbi:LacI family DNA-binding transcriptional regulator [Microbacterium insulae]|uniref:LacI family DNA-binding transcriptional regulator n=1 Tax=Microbacterium insulae TaxID=483014 RepID=A0ABW3AF59_9MICO
MPAPARGAATLHDVAREAGVSLATASRVLNGSTRKVAESYRVRVQAAADLLGYTPNLSAQATARGTTAVIALMVADIADAATGRLVAGVARAADEAGLVLTVAVTAHDPEREIRVVRALRGQRPRGLIVEAAPADGPDASTLTAELEALSGTGGRVVVIGREVADVPAVATDDRAGASALGEELAGLGYREAVVIAADRDIPAFEARATGFREGFERAGGRIVEVRRTGVSRDAGYDAARALLEAGLAPGTLIFVVRDAVAIGVMSALRDAGRAVGADIAVAGFDDIPSAADAAAPLTTVRVPLEELGRRAVQAVLEPDGPGEPALAVEVVVRASTPGRR